MKGKIQKRIIGCFSGLVAFLCMCFMISLKNEGSTPVQNQPQQTQYETQQETQQETQTEVRETFRLDESKLNIELPEELTEQDIQISNDYVNHTISIRFAKAAEHYLEEYDILGSRSHVENLTYYEEGVLEINLDMACEIFYSFEENYLCMEIKDLHEVYEKIVVIDAGHGGSQPGAVEDEVCEKSLNLEIVQKLKALLDDVDEKKLKVFYTRLEDSDVSLQARVNMANQLNADLFISVHNNAAPDESYYHYNGTMVLYSQRQSEDQSRRLAQICLENVIGSCGSGNEGLVEGDEIYIIRKSKVPVALIEVGYMTNAEEFEKLCNSEYQRKVAQGIYNAIMQAFEEGF